MTSTPKTSNPPSSVALGHVRVASMLAFAVALLTVFYSFYRRAHDEYFPFLASLFEPGVVALLGFGTWKKSRVCVTLLCAYWVGAKIFVFSRLASGPTDWAIAGMCFFCFFRGTVSSFDYHELIKKEQTTEVRS